MTMVQPSKAVGRRTVIEEDVLTYDARDLIHDGAQVRILLDDQSYWLRITRAGKLILTK